jgi:hypothetical protein
MVSVPCLAYLLPMTTPTTWGSGWRGCERGHERGHERGVCERECDLLDLTQQGELLVVEHTSSLPSASTHARMQLSLRTRMRACKAILPSAIAVDTGGRTLPRAAQRRRGATEVPRTVWLRYGESFLGWPAGSTQ